MKHWIYKTAMLFAVVMQPALAHHSFAMFDRTKVGVLEGTLYTVEWVNPHGWFWISTVTSAGKEEVWGFEGASPSSFSREGFTKKDFVVGTKVKIEYNPLKDGRTGGKFLRMTFPDGRTVGSLESAIDRYRKDGLIN